MLATGFLIRDRVVTGHLMLATGFLIRDWVVTEGETDSRKVSARLRGHKKCPLYLVNPTWRILHTGMGTTGTDTGMAPRPSPTTGCRHRFHTLSKARPLAPAHATAQLHVY